VESKVEFEMRKVHIVADSAISPLGITSEDNFQQVAAGASGVRQLFNRNFGDAPFYLSHCSELKAIDGDTRFEMLASLALVQLNKKVSLPKKKTIFILSTTKGNIEVLEQGQPDHPRIHLHQVADKLASMLGVENNIVVSNACTSGVVAIDLAKRHIENGNYDHAVVLGADALSRFIISGFQSLNALSALPCKPFDATRTGLNLGEAAAAVLITAFPQEFSAPYKVAVMGGAITNDSNHISGPSKTGQELAMAISQAMAEAHVAREGIDFISAHGTATLYNDEMESKAFYLSNMSGTPMHSLKGNFGHTLGAAGVIETVMCVHSLVNQELIPSAGFENLGVPHPVNIIRKRETAPIRRALKTASGFGGCNAAIVLQIEN
jgi:3-oxoacyl-[acyl-carrier-protein] synthase I